MTSGLFLICVIALPLAAGLLLLGGRLRARREPLSRSIRSPGGGLIEDPAERLAATHRIGRAAQWLGLGLLGLTLFLVWQDWRAGRLDLASKTGTHVTIGDQLRLAAARPCALGEGSNLLQGVLQYA